MKGLLLKQDRHHKPAKLFWEDRKKSNDNNLSQVKGWNAWIEIEWRRKRSFINNKGRIRHLNIYAPKWESRSLLKTTAKRLEKYINLNTVVVGDCNTALSLFGYIGFEEKVEERDLEVI